VNPSALFIGRPVATVLLTIAIAIAGGIAFMVLPVSPLPQVDFPTITVAAGLPGASPDIMASSIATPLERQFGHIAGVTEMTSASSLGTTSITLQFDLSRDINGAARDVEAGINAARTYLPANLPANPTYRKVNPADSPILVLGLQSDVYDIPTLYDEASTVISQRISQISGVGQVTVVGASLPAVRIELNPNQLASYGISLPQVQRIVAGQNSNSAKGQIADGNIESGRLQAAGGGLFERGSGSPPGCCRRGRLPADHPASRLPQREAFGQYADFPAAGRQHHHYSGCRAGRDPIAGRHHPEGRASGHGARPHPDHSRVRLRY
jgi:multidrug efflux pump subunit AcrB